MQPQRFSCLTLLKCDSIKGYSSEYSGVLHLSLGCSKVEEITLGLRVVDLCYILYAVVRHLLDLYATLLSLHVCNHQRDFFIFFIFIFETL